MTFEYYFDTGILVKTYVLERNSVDAAALISEAGDPLAYSHLHAIETPNAIRLKLFRGEISEKQKSESLSALQADLNSGRLARPAYELAAVEQRAKELSAKWTASLGTRSLDLLHVAIALEIGCSKFASFDSRQRECAAKAGFRVLP